MSDIYAFGNGNSIEVKEQRMSEEVLIELFPELRDEPAEKVFKILEEMEKQDNE